MANSMLCKVCLLASSRSVLKILPSGCVNGLSCFVAYNTDSDAGLQRRLPWLSRKCTGNVTHAMQLRNIFRYASDSGRLGRWAQKGVLNSKREMECRAGLHG